MARRSDRRTREFRCPNDPRRNPEPAINGPTPEAIGEAMAQLRQKVPTSIPPLSALKTLEEAGFAFPLVVQDRKIIRMDMARGRPQHGAMRTDDHISGYEVEFPQECPEEDCHSQVTRYEYHANHNIAGSEQEYCPRCETVHSSDEWS